MKILLPKLKVIVTGDNGSSSGDESDFESLHEDGGDIDQLRCYSPLLSTS